MISDEPKKICRQLRLDRLLVDRGFFSNLKQAQSAILAGEVLVNEVPVTKAGYKFPAYVEIRLRREKSRYVGRGGDKLEGALSELQLDVSGMIGLDVGSSTGGFTDCLLRHGAQLVYAVDVGTNQLDYKLRIDHRVRVMEQTHVRDLMRDQFDPLPNIVTVDLSFISARLALHYILPVISADAKLLVLVKPQFELPAERVSTGGVVQSEQDRQVAVELVKGEGEKLGMACQAAIASAVKGARSGNQEYFVLFSR